MVFCLFDGFKPHFQPYFSYIVAEDQEKITDLSQVTDKQDYMLFLYFSLFKNIFSEFIEQEFKTLFKDPLTLYFSFSSIEIQA
jgi:hypothetical protein